MKTILVTGATGFCGSPVLTSLSKRTDLQIVAACRDKSRLPSEYSGPVREGDLTDTDYVETVLTDVDTVCHCAAWSSLYRHARQSRELFLEPSIQLIDAARKAGVRRFINTSSTIATG